MSKKKTYNLDKDFVDRFTNATNRSISQTEFLFNLVDGDLLKLIELEEKIKNNFIFYCPGDKREVNKILKMGYENYRFKFQFYMTIHDEPLSINQFKYRKK